MSTIKIQLDTKKYRTPTTEDIRAAKQYILQREEAARTAAASIDNLLADAAVKIVLICYAYNVKPKELLFSATYNDEMMMEISDVMDILLDTIYTLIPEYATRGTADRDILPALTTWLLSLGRGNKNLSDTLEGYLFKTMKDWEAAIAAMRFMGRTEQEAATLLTANLHNIYGMPDVLTAMRSRQEFTSTLIYLGGVQKGAVGISNNGSTNVVNMAKITIQMGWMRSKAMEWEKAGVAGYWQDRGSTYNCDVCDDEVGFHPDINEIYKKPLPHAHCQCWRIPIYLNENYGTIN